MAFSATETSPVVSIPAGSSATTTVASALDNGGAKANHSCVAIASTGTTAGTVVFQVSHDGVNWVQPSSGQPTAFTAAGIQTGTLTGFPAQFVRAQISVAFVGGTVAVTVASA